MDRSRLSPRIRDRWKHAIDKSASRISTLGWSDSSVPPPRHQPAALIRQHLIFDYRTLDGCLLVGALSMMPTSFAGVPLMW
jgi:hypothetical protein